jgi:hypothetical protein
MEIETFKILLKKANLTKKSLSDILNTSYQSVNNWGTNGRGYPYWVQSWLELYIENKDCKELKEIIRENVCK